MQADFMHRLLMMFVTASLVRFFFAFLFPCLHSLVGSPLGGGSGADDNMALRVGTLSFLLIIAVIFQLEFSFENDCTDLHARTKALVKTLDKNCWTTTLTLVSSFSC